MGRASRKKKENRLKNKYSKPFTRPDVKELMNEYVTPINEETLKSALAINNPLMFQGEDINLQYSEIFQGCCDYVKYIYDYHNYFVADESVIDFVENNKANTKDLYHVKDIIFDRCKERSNNIMDVPYFAGAFHFANRKHSLVFMCLKDRVGRYVLLCDGFNPETKKDLLSIAMLPEEWTGTESYIESGNPSKMTKYYSEIAINTIANLFFYMDAFPESIIEGVPPMQDVENPGHTIKANHKLMHINHTSVSPHLRRGHFRFLKSEVFKKKRYQTVYVKPTMVKGKASYITEGDKND